jgi:hypothetical protein
VVIRRLTLLVGLVLAIGGCNEILGIPERERDPHLECDDSGCRCQGGFENCDGEADNGCETDLATSSAHCGACGHDCLGGDCEGGKCAPVALASFDIANGLALVGDEIYVGTCDDDLLVVKFPATGGTPTPVVVPGGSSCAWRIAANASSILWIDQTDLRVNPLDGVVETPPLTPADSFAPLAASDTHAYYGLLTGGQDVLMRIALAGGAPETIATASVNAMVTSPTRAYWSDSDGTWSVSHTGTDVTQLFPDTVDHAYALAIDAENLYFGSSFFGAGSVGKLPLAGGEPVFLDDSVEAVGIAVDATHLYWADEGTGSLNRVPIAGGASEVLVEGLAFDLIVSMAADDRGVYWQSDDTIYVWVK